MDAEPPEILTEAPARAVEIDEVEAFKAQNQPVQCRRPGVTFLTAAGCRAFQRRRPRNMKRRESGEMDDKYRDRIQDCMKCPNRIDGAA